MTKVKTTWDYSTDSEVGRIMQCAHQMIVGFYRANNFYVVPLHSNFNNSQVVYFPDLPYNKIPRFWKHAKQTNIHTLPIQIDNKVADKLKNLFKEEKIKEPNYKNTKNIWDKASGEIIEEIYRVIPEKKDFIKEIIIYPTVIGTTCSFQILKQKPDRVKIRLREDQGIYAITEAILSALTFHDVENKLGGMWSESELLVDWLVTESSIAKVLKKYQPITNFTPTMNATRVKQNAKLLKTSEKFYKKLGIIFEDKVVEIRNNKVFINGKNASNLTKREKDLLNLLVENSNNIVSFDEIGDLIFNNEDDFSLWAISKTMQRLRNKLENNGISGSHIQTLRGQGYLLKN